VEGFSCDLESSCQPIAARGDKEMNWPANVRDISASGLGLVLRRRFEPGAGLAIDVHGTDSIPPFTLLARVVHATALPDGRWVLGCAFVSELSDDELRALLQLARAQAALSESSLFHQPLKGPTSTSGAPPRAFVIRRFQLEGTTQEGGRFRRFVRSLHLTGSWPLPVGTVLRVRAAREETTQPSVTIRVKGCRYVGSRLTLSCDVMDASPADLAVLLG
jgi:hypothetical protein